MSTGSAGLVPASFSTLLTGRAAEGSPTGDEWLRGLPHLVDDLLDQWELRIDGESMHGVAALVVPVRRTDGSAAVLKLTWPHPEAAHEHLALRHWGGRGAVRLLAANPTRFALLLERLDSGRDLWPEPIDAACAAIGDLLGQLDRPAPPQLPTLSGHVAATSPLLAGGAPGQVPRRFVDQATSLARELTADGAVDARLVHTDLHFRNVLAGQRQPWLAIDPKPLAAEPAYAVAPALWNRWDEALDSRDVRRHLRRRLSVICEHAGLDEARARAWTIVREVHNAAWAAADGDRDRITVAVAVIKAMQE